MPGERIWSTYRDGNWSAPFDDPASPWYHASLTADLVGYVPRGGYGQHDLDNVTAGDTVIISHAVTVDVDSSAGNSIQGQSWVPVPFAAMGGSALTRLATGTYRASYTLGSAYGESGVGLSESVPVAITNGVSRPRVQFPGPPPAGCTYRLYLTAPGGASGTGRTYCYGITGPYVDLVGDKWGNAYSNGVADGGLGAIGGQYLPPAIRITTAVTIAAGGSLTIAAGKLLTLRGDLVIESPTGSTDDWITFEAGASIGFDSTLAKGPSQAEYAYWFQGGGKIAFEG